MFKKKQPTRREAKRAARAYRKERLGLDGGDPSEAQGEDFGYCPTCHKGWHIERCPVDPMDWPLCPEDKTPLKLPRDETTEDGALALFLGWLQEMRDKGLWGPSPTEAAAYLGCHRTTIDDLVDRSVLQRNQYEDRFGHSVVMISSTSLELAARNKAETGSYTRRKLGRPKGSRNTPKESGEKL